MGFTTIATLTIFLLALKHGEKNIVRADWLSLVFAGIALLLWFWANDPLLAIILITLVDVVGGFFPTFRNHTASRTKKQSRSTSCTLFLGCFRWQL